MNLSLKLAVIVLFLALVNARNSHALVSASITGIVMDASGAPVPCASVLVKNAETGAARASLTNNAGRDLVLSLPVGESEVKVSKGGLQHAVRSGIAGEVG